MQKKSLLLTWCIKVWRWRILAIRISWRQRCVLSFAKLSFLSHDTSSSSDEAENRSVYLPPTSDKKKLNVYLKKTYPDIAAKSTFLQVAWYAENRAVYLTLASRNMYARYKTPVTTQILKFILAQYWMLFTYSTLLINNPSSCGRECKQEHGHFNCAILVHSGRPRLQLWRLAYWIILSCCRSGIKWTAGQWNLWGVCQWGFYCSSLGFWTGDGTEMAFLENLGDGAFV